MNFHLIIGCKLHLSETLQKPWKSISLFLTVGGFTIFQKVVNCFKKNLILSFWCSEKRSFLIPWRLNILANTTTGDNNSNGWNSREALTFLCFPYYFGFGIKTNKETKKSFKLIHCSLNKTKITVKSEKNKNLFSQLILLTGWFDQNLSKILNMNFPPFFILWNTDTLAS